MKYHVLHIKTDFAEEWQADVFNQQICELGVDTIDAGDYYIPSETWTQNADKCEKIFFLLQISKKSSNFALAFSEFKLLNKVLWNNLYIRHGR